METSPSRALARRHLPQERRESGCGGRGDVGWNRVWCPLPPNLLSPCCGTEGRAGDNSRDREGDGPANNQPNKTNQGTKKFPWINKKTPMDTGYCWECAGLGFSLPSALGSRRGAEDCKAFAAESEEFGVKPPKKLRTDGFEGKKETQIPSAARCLPPGHCLVLC